MHPTRSLSLAAVPFFAVVLAACGGATEAVGDKTTEPQPSGTQRDKPGIDGGTTGNGPGSGETCTAAPGCLESENVFASASACPADAACVERKVCGSAGGHVWCSPKPSTCAPVRCRPGFFEVNGCVPDSECVKEIVCGKTILCQRDESQCDGLPACDGTDVQVANQAACPQDVACYSRTVCGATIWCTPAP